MAGAKRGQTWHAAGAKTGDQGSLASYLVVDVSAVLPEARAAAAAEGLPVEDRVAGLLQALTPRLMRWSETLWVLDLSVCASYWEARAEAEKTDAVHVVRSLLQTLVGRGGRAALADHPWQALLLARHMQERRLSGLVLGNGSFGSNLYREISWSSWWRCTEDLAEHLAQPGERRFDAALFRRQCNQMRRAMKRLGLLMPWQLRDVAPLSLKRRFGSTLRDLWQWSYSETLPSTSPGQPRGLFAVETDALFESGFPWQSFVLTSLPQVSRDLDDPLCEWQHIEPLLREDFDRLCALSSWLVGEKVVSLEWRIVLRDLSSHVVPVRFRHPHSLHLEKGLHATALLQALYSFEAEFLRQRRQTASIISPIIAWELVIKERLTMPPGTAGLFSDCHEGLTLLQLENKLPIQLTAFALKEDWLPEDSFGLPDTAAAEVHPPEMRAAYRHSLHAVARGRPLYLYNRPAPFDDKGRSSLWQFAERTMSKWWQAAAEGNLQRDYYRLTDVEGKALWVFKNGRGQWFVHGVFA